jgi:uncharacterized membrane protein YccC
VTRYLIPLSRDQVIYFLRVGFAVAGAYLLSHGSDPSGPLYAVLAAALVMGESTGEGIGVSRNRVIGSIVGVLVAIPIAALGQMSAAIIAAVCLIAGVIGLLIGGIPVARVAMTVAIVSMLLHTGDVTHYGLYRITNTVIGVVVAVAVSYAFWPFARDALSRVLSTVLTGSAELLQTVASSERTDLRRRRQRSLFKALGDLPKAHKEAHQDPLLQWRSPLRDETVALVVEIAHHVLALSFATGRLPPDHRAAAWWAHFAGGLTTASERLRTVSGYFTAAPPAPPSGRFNILPLERPTIAEAEREAVDDLWRNLRLMHDRLGELGVHVQTWERERRRSAGAPA